MPWLYEKASQLLHAAGSVELLLRGAAGASRELGRQLYRQLEAQQGRLLADMRAALLAMEAAEGEQLGECPHAICPLNRPPLSPAPTSHAPTHSGDSLGPLLRSLPSEVLSRHIICRLRASDVRGVCMALRAAFDACNPKLTIKEASCLNVLHLVCAVPAPSPKPGPWQPCTAGAHQGMLQHGRGAEDGSGTRAASATPAAAACIEGRSTAGSGGGHRGGSAWSAPPPHSAGP